MSQETEELYAGNSPDQPVEPLSWHQTWILALIRPTIDTFERIIRDPKASAGRAYTWIFIAVIFSSLIEAVFTLPGSIGAMIGSITQDSYVMPGDASGVEEILTPFYSVICAPVLALVQILAFIVIIAIQQWIAGRAFGGRGTYAMLAYAIAAYSAPLAIIGSLLGGIPALICLSFALLIYSTVLDIVAVKAVNRISWGGAVVSAIGGYLLVMFVAMGLTLCVFIALGPAITEIFQNI